MDLHSVIERVPGALLLPLLCLLWTPTEIEVSFDYSGKRLAPASNECCNKPCSNNAQQAYNVTRSLSPNLPQYHSDLTRARPAQDAALQHITKLTLE